MFFAALALIMIGVKDRNDRRDSWHHGGWIAKMVIWLLLVVLMFFLPDVVISIYGTLSSLFLNFLLFSVVFRSIRARVLKSSVGELCFAAKKFKEAFKLSVKFL